MGRKLIDPKHEGQVVQQGVSVREPKNVGKRHLLKAVEDNLERI